MCIYISLRDKNMVSEESIEASEGIEAAKV